MSNGLPGLAAAVRNLQRDCRGATSIEYALLAALIALGISAALITLGGSVRLPFQNAAAGLGVEQPEGGEDAVE